MRLFVNSYNKEFFFPHSAVYLCWLKNQKLTITLMCPPGRVLENTMLVNLFPEFIY